MRLRIALVAAVAGLTLGLLGVPALSAANDTPHGPPNGHPHGPPNGHAPLYTVQGVNGVASNGDKFSGTYGIFRFVIANQNNKPGVYSVGVLKGTFEGHRITRWVMMPAGLTGDPPNGQASTRAAVDPPQVCPVLNLVLGPINLNLLGLQVAVGGGTITPGQPATVPITVQLNAISGPNNLLGNLLCGLSSALQPPGGTSLLGQLNSNLMQLQATLNGILNILSGL